MEDECACDWWSAFLLPCPSHLSGLPRYLNKHYFYWLGNVTSFCKTLSYFASSVSLEPTLVSWSPPCLHCRNSTPSGLDSWPALSLSPPAPTPGFPLLYNLANQRVVPDQWHGYHLGACQKCRIWAPFQTCGARLRLNRVPQDLCAHESLEALPRLHFLPAIGSEPLPLPTSVFFIQKWGYLLSFLLHHRAVMGLPGRMRSARGTPWH